MFATSAIPQPKDVPTPKTALFPPLDLVIEVRSPSDSITELAAKANEYLEAGVRVVVTLDPNSDTAAVYRSGRAVQRLESADDLTLPDILPGFSVPVAKFFE
jgi:Uma2 family endonuclease